MSTRLNNAQFWKQFFEASANVSLSGYEEPQHEDTTVHDEDETTHADVGQPDVSSSQLDETITSPEKPAAHSFSDDDLLSSPSMGGGRHSTPRMPTTAAKAIDKSSNIPKQPTFADDYPSPYEALKQQMDGRTNGKAAAAPTTPGKNTVLPDMSMTPDTSPFNPHIDPPASIMSEANKDTLLHQGILNKNFRVQATPHTARKTTRFGATPGTANRTRRILDFEDTMSSPLEEAPAPRLRGVFSPMKGPRTPGKSILTPNVKKQFEERRTRESNTDAGASVDVTRGRTGGLTSRSIAWDSDSEDDDDLGMSPPKTIMFNLPESRIMRTPGKFRVLGPNCSQMLTIS
jgi:DASH complex subunit ASK1